MTSPVREPQAAQFRSGASFKGAPLDLSTARSPLFDALLKSRREHGGAIRILQDQDGEPISYNALVRASYALGAKLAKITSPDKTVGILLPTCASAVIAFFALHAWRRVPAVLNFRSGGSNLQTACSIAGVKHIITARRFIEGAGLDSVVSRLESSVSFIYLEDVRQSITLADKAFSLCLSLVPRLLPRPAKPEDAAVILFTSGTTGAPKGVALSHFNILANIAQCRARIPFDMNWVFFNVLPIFHALGLTGGTLLPLLGGMRTVLYPSPLDHNRIPNIIRTTGANVLIATDTFLRLYARAADYDSLSGLLYVVLGGEKANQRTLHLFSQKSAAHVLQGYGVTECGPVIAVNQPQTNRSGTVGRLLPGMEARLEPAPGISNGQKLLVRGPNVMMGYLDPSGGGVHSLAAGEWFDTGDLAQIDADGFITITGRVARFARVGAETVSLASVEEHARVIWPEANHAALAVMQAEGREMIVLVTDQKGAERAELAAWARRKDSPSIEVPQRVFHMRKLPLLPAGKPDYFRIRRIIERRFGGKSVLAYPAKGASGEVSKLVST